MRRPILRKLLFSGTLFTLVALVSWPITSRSAPQVEENPAVVAARADLDRALANAQADPTKAAELELDRARDAYYTAVAEHADEIRAIFQKLADAPGLMQDPELAGPVRDYETLGALDATAVSESLLGTFASGTETEPNNTSATANPVAALDPCSQMGGTINPIADLDFFSFPAVAGDRLWAVVDTGSPPAQVGTSRDSILDLLSTDGATLIETDDDDGTGNGGDGTIEAGLASVIAGRTFAAAGSYFLRVTEFGNNNTLDPYRLHAIVSNASHQTAEVEPNGTSGTANRIIPAGAKIGVRAAAISVAGEADFYSFPAKAGDRLLIVADGDPERDNVSTNVDFQLLAPDGVTVLITASSSSNSGGFTGEGFAYNVTSSGTYFVRVFAAAGITGTYHLMASDCTSFACVVNADCADGNPCTDDVCNADGSCSNPNNAAPCDDGVFCNGPDTCAGGTCSVPSGIDPCAGGPQCNNVCNELLDNCFSPIGTACGSPTDTYCTDPDTCDGGGTCRPNNRPDGSPCVSTCTNNVCTGGVCTGPSGSTCLAPILYGSAYSGPDGLATLYRIDSSTGAFVAIGPIGFQRVGAIDFGPDGRLYGVGERNDGTNTNVLIVIDTATGAGTEIGPTGVAALGFGDAVADISFRRSDGRLYAYLEPSDGVGVIDPATGAASAVGPTGIGDSGNGMAFSRSNVLYQAGATVLTRINQATGVKTVVASLSFVGFGGSPRVNGMDAEPSSGVLFGSVNTTFGGGGAADLATIDTTGVVTRIGPTVTDLDAIAWQPNRCLTTLYGVTHAGPTGASTLHRVDPDTGGAVAVGPIGFNGVSGMDFHPMTKTLFAVGKRPVTQTDVLIRIDPATGIGTEIGPLVNAGLGAGGGGLFDVSFRSDGTLFMTAFDPAFAFKIFTINLATGLATAVGTTNVSGGGNALGFTLTDSLFQATTSNPNNTLYLVNQATGAASLSTAITYVGFPPPTVFYRSDSMDVDPSSGVPFVAVNDGSAGTGPTYLGTLNVRTGRIDRIGLTAPGLDALAWLSDCDDGVVCTVDECVRCEDAELYGAQFSGPDGLATLFRINPATGAAVAIGPIGFQRVSAMDYDEVAGVIYATGERNDGSNTNVLLTIDPTTGAGTEVGPTGVTALGFGNVESDLSFRNSDGRLYAYIEGGDGVATINPATGAAAAVGPTGISSLGNGMEFSRGDVLYSAGTTLTTINQSTGAKTFVATLTFLGFPTLNFPRVNAMDVNCAGTMYVTVNDAFQGAGPTYLATLDLATGRVTHIGQTIAGIDALVWRTTHGFCRQTFVDTDSDGVCDPSDCAPGDPTAFAVPGEVAIAVVTKTGPTTADYLHSNAGGGIGTVHDVVGDLLTNLPVGPGGGSEIFSCGYSGTIVTFSGNPAANTGFWLVIRGHNACGAGSYGNTKTNPGPPLNGPPRTTTTCP